MAIGIGLALALGKAGMGLAKGIKGQMQTKNATTAGLIDPTQTAMVNLMHRERRAMATGTSDAPARNALAREGKNLTRRSILGGKRDLGDYIKFRAANEAAITEARAGERLGMLKSITDETKAQSNRSMDLVELEGERQRTYGQAAKQTGSKNFMSQIPVIQEGIEGAFGGAGEAKSSTEEPTTPAPASPSEPRVKKVRKKKMIDEMFSKVGSALNGALNQAGKTGAN